MNVMESLKENDERAFFSGVLVCLQVLHQFDAHTQATEIVETVGGIDLIKKYAEYSGSEVEADTLGWIKTGIR